MQNEEIGKSVRSLAALMFSVAVGLTAFIVVATLVGDSRSVFSLVALISIPALTFLGVAIPLTKRSLRP